MSPAVPALSSSSPAPVENPERQSPAPTPAPSATPSAAAPDDAFADFPLPPSLTPRPRKRLAGVKLTTEEEAASARAAARVASLLTADHISTLFPNVDTPFQSVQDAVHRLLPYHIFQHPKEDLGKGKQKATDQDLLKEELAETKFALKCMKRKRALEERFRRARTSSGKRTSFDDQAYFLEQAVLETDRQETASTTATLRGVRAELEKIEREKRAAAAAARTSSFSSATTTTQQPSTPAYAHHYRPYHYQYAPYSAMPMPHGGSTSNAGYSYSTPGSQAPFISQYVPQMSAAPTPAVSHVPTPAVSRAPTPAVSHAPSPAPPTPSPMPTLPPPPGAIPVQLPVSSLPALHALGIVPVPASATLREEGQPPPPAVLLGSSANGTMLSLEINLSLLQAAQMSGLALVLNSIMRGAAAEAGMPPPAPYTQMGAPYSYPMPAAPMQAQAQGQQPSNGTDESQAGRGADAGG